MSYTPDNRIAPNKAVEPTGSSPSQQQPAGDFKSYMQGSEQASGSTSLQGATSPQAPPTMDSIASQAKQTHDSLGTVKNQLNDPNLQLNRSQTHLVKNKLTTAQDYIRQAGSKVGV
jgi:hypothetical protein